MASKSLGADVVHSIWETQRERERERERERRGEDRVFKEEV